MRTLQEILDSARATPPSSRVGRYKVPVFLLNLTEEEKCVLVSAHRSGKARLARLDLQGSYDRQAVAESRLTYMSAEWHLVDLE